MITIHDQKEGNINIIIENVYPLYILWSVINSVMFLDYVGVEETDGCLLKEYITSDDKKYVKKPIDKSTTFFKLHEVTNDCLMYEFAETQFPGYQPEDGYGYLKTIAGKLKETSRHKKLILMAEVRSLLNLLA